MAWIKVINFGRGGRVDVLVNLDRVTSIVRYENNDYTTIHFERDNFVAATETPEEIRGLILNAHERISERV